MARGCEGFAAYHCKQVVVLIARRIGYFGHRRTCDFDGSVGLTGSSMTFSFRVQFKISFSIAATSSPRPAGLETCGAPALAPPTVSKPL